MLQRIFILTFLAIFSSGLLNAADIEGWFLYDNVIRSYIFHIPPQHNVEDLLPLVISMHGYTSSAEGQAAYTGFNAKADTEGFYVVYPNGTGSLQSWNAGQCCGFAAENDVDDVGFISDLIDTIIANYTVDTLRIYATGMSNGGMMSHRLACDLSGRIAAAAPVAGGLMLSDWDACQPLRSVPVIHFHAVDDGVVPYYGGNMYGIDFPDILSVMQGWAERTGCDAGPDSLDNGNGAFCKTWSDSESEVEVVLWTTLDGGHTWPGRPGGSQAISANDKMWEFFKIHPIPSEEPEPSVTECPEYVFDPLVPGIFTESSCIRFSLKDADEITVELYDVLGRMVTYLRKGTLSAGEHVVEIDCSSYAKGVYICRLVTSSETSSYIVRVVQ